MQLVDQTAGAVLDYVCDACVIDLQWQRLACADGPRQRTQAEHALTSTTDQAAGMLWCDSEQCEPYSAASEAKLEYDGAVVHLSGVDADMQWSQYMEGQQHKGVRSRSPLVLLQPTDPHHAQGSK
jgi:hypothetical protein